MRVSWGISCPLRERRGRGLFHLPCPLAEWRKPSGDIRSAAAFDRGAGLVGPPV